MKPAPESRKTRPKMKSRNATVRGSHSQTESGMETGSAVVGNGSAIAESSEAEEESESDESSGSSSSSSSSSDEEMAVEAIQVDQDGKVIPKKRPFVGSIFEGKLASFIICDECKNGASSRFSFTRKLDTDESPIF